MSDVIDPRRLDATSTSAQDDERKLPIFQLPKKVRESKFFNFKCRS